MKTTWAYIIMLIGLIFIFLAILAYLDYKKNYGNGWAKSSTPWLLIVVAIFIILTGFIVWAIVKKPKGDKEDKGDKEAEEVKEVKEDKEAK